MPGNGRYLRLMQAVDRIMLRFGPSNQEAARVITAYGKSLTPQAIGYWKRQGRIPHWWQKPLQEIAAELGDPIPRRDMIAAVMGE